MVEEEGRKMTDPKPLNLGDETKIPEIEVKKYMNVFFSEKEKREILQKYKTFSKAGNFCDIEKDLAFYYYSSHNRRCITRTALRLMHKLEKMNIEIFPAIFKCFTNFCAYPEAYRFYVYEYVKSQNRVVRLYFNVPVKECLKKDSCKEVMEHE